MKNGQEFELELVESFSRMLGICCEYSPSAQIIYLYIVNEDGMVYSDFATKIHGRIVRAGSTRSPDFSEDGYDDATDALTDEVFRLQHICETRGTDVPTLIKLVFDVAAERLDSSIGYDQVTDPDSDISPNDLFRKWTDGFAIDAATWAISPGDGAWPGLSSFPPPIP